MVVDLALLLPARDRACDEVDIAAVKFFQPVGNVLVVRREFHRRLAGETAATPFQARAAVGGHVDEINQRGLRRAGTIQHVTQFIGALGLVTIERGEKKLFLVAERPIQTAAVQAHLSEQIINAGGGVSAFPERFHRFLCGGIGIKLFRSGHGRGSTPDSGGAEP
jgi:hypothetical protein